MMPVFNACIFVISYFQPIVVIEKKIANFFCLIVDERRRDIYFQENFRFYSGSNLIFRGLIVDFF